MNREKAVELYKEIVSTCSFGVCSWAIVGSINCNVIFKSCELRLISKINDFDKEVIKKIARSHELSLKEIDDGIVIS